MKPLKPEEIKKNLGEKAASLVQDGMQIGLGTGTTATFFIESLIKRCQAGLNISAVCSSLRSMEQAVAGGIPLLSNETFTTLDLTIDGADEIDRMGRIIKGGGGALTREKILASSSKRWIVVADESKLVPALGKFGVPIEIIFFGYQATLFKIQQLGYKGKLRVKADGMPYITDNGNVIFDIRFPDQYSEPGHDHERLINIAGVVETGFFINFAAEVLIGHQDGTISCINY